MSDELKPCPFCGGAAERREDTGVTGVPYGLVILHKDECFLTWEVQSKSDDTVDAAWNTRATVENAEPVDFDLPPHMDSDFVAAWCKMEDDGYSYSESNVAKVHLGWLMARKYVPTDLAARLREARREALEDAAQVAERWIEPALATPHENGTYRSIAASLRALSEGTCHE